MCRELLTAGRPWSYEFIAGTLIRSDKEVSSSVGNADASKVFVLWLERIAAGGTSAQLGPHELWMHGTHIFGFHERSDGSGRLQSHTPVGAEVGLGLAQYESIEKT